MRLKRKLKSRWREPRDSDNKKLCRVVQSCDVRGMDRQWVERRMEGGSLLFDCLRFSFGLDCDFVGRWFSEREGTSVELRHPPLRLIM